MKPKILVVDDDAYCRKMITVVLSEVGYEIKQANDGQLSHKSSIFLDKVDELEVFGSVRKPCLSESRFFLFYDNQYQ